MTHRVIITGKAERDLRDAAHWWRDERSTEDANCWLAGMVTQIQSLEENPTRCCLAVEDRQFPVELRELQYGMGQRLTHRIIFTMEERLVVVLSVRHRAEVEVRLEELTS